MTVFDLENCELRICFSFNFSNWIQVFRQQVKMQNQADKWCLYFNSTVEQQRFLAAVDDALSKAKQVLLTEYSHGINVETQCGLS